MKLERKQGIYEKYVKRFFDFICSFLTIICFFWLYLILAVMVRIKMGSPVLFKQPRPGIVKNGRETIFDMYKFRTMTDERGADGELLPDEKRLTPFGAWLRNTSLDELPQVFNVLRGDMSLIGPRPQLVRDMVFMSDEQRMRHTAKPGLSGLAQTQGRNLVTWDDKLAIDLKYIEKVSFWNDFKLLFGTVLVAIKQKGITDGENATALDYGDLLLKHGRVSKEKYDELQEYARELIAEHERK